MGTINEKVIISVFADKIISDSVQFLFVVTVVAVVMVEYILTNIAAITCL